MYYLVKTGRTMFAAGILALGIVCFIDKDFIIGRPPAWPANWALNPALGYITGSVMILCAIAIFIKKKSGQAALLAAILIVLFSISRHIPTFMTTWPNAYKAMALVGGCFIIAAACSADSDAILRFSLNKKLILTGTVLLAIFLLVCGYAHFKYAAFVDTLIPAYIPFHSFWTYCCGVLLFAGGAGLLLPATRQLAALLSGIMIGGWFLLLHIPRFLANANDASDRMGVCESFAFAGICFCLAGLLRKENKFSAVVDKGAYLNEII